MIIGMINLRNIVYIYISFWLLLGDKFLFCNVVLFYFFMGFLLGVIIFKWLNF